MSKNIKLAKPATESRNNNIKLAKPATERDDNTSHFPAPDAQIELQVPVLKRNFASKTKNWEGVTAEFKVGDKRETITLSVAQLYREAKAKGAAVLAALFNEDATEVLAGGVSIGFAQGRIMLELA